MTNEEWQEMRRRYWEKRLPQIEAREVWGTRREDHALQTGLACAPCGYGPCIFTGRDGERYFRRPL